MRAGMLAAVLFYLSGWFLCALAPSQLHATPPAQNTTPGRNASLAPPPAAPWSAGALPTPTSHPFLRAAHLARHSSTELSHSTWEGDDTAPTDALEVVWLVLTSRALIGVALGLVCTSVSSYQTDIAPTRIRGTTGSCFQLSIVMGQPLPKP